MRRLLFPIIRKYWKLLLGTAVVSALGCTIIIGLSSGYLSIDRAMSRYLDEYNYPDAYLTTEATDLSRLDDILAVPGVRAADARIFADTIVKDHTGRYLSVRVFSYGEDDLQRFFFWSTADPQGADEAYLDYSFADVNGIHAGDTLLCRADDEWYEVFISALVSMPETLAVQPTNGDWDSNADFGYAYIPHRQVEKASDIFYDKSVARLDEKRQELDDAKKALDDGRKELENARTALGDAKQLLEERTAEYDEGTEALAAAESEISSARSSIQSNRSSLDASQAELNSRSAALAPKRTELSEAKAQVDSAQAEIDSGYAQIRATETELVSGQAEIDAATAEIDTQEAYVRQNYVYIPSEILIKINTARAELSYKQAEIDSAWQEVYRKRAELDSAQAELSAKAAPVREAWDEFSRAQAQIDSAQAQINSGYAQLRSAEARLAAMEQEYTNAVKTLEDGDRAIHDAEQDLAEKQLEFDSAEADFLKKQKELDDAEEALETALDKLDRSRFGDKCNQFLLWFEDGADPDTTLSSAADSLGDLECGYKYTFSDSAVSGRINAALHPIGTMSVFIPEVFFVVLLVIVFLFMSLIIRQCRREIGILRANGFTVGSIRRLFCSVNLIVSAAAVVVGVGLGRALGIYVGAMYRNYFPIPVFDHLVDVKMLVISVAATLLIGQLATLISATYIAKIRPAEAMSRPAPSTVRIPGLLAKLTRNASPMTKFSVTSLLRNRLRFVFSAICLAASVMMIFASLAFFSSRTHILRETFDERIHYDCQIFFSGPISDDTVEGLEGLGYLRDVQELPWYNSEISFGGRTENAVVNAPQQGTTLLGIFDRSGGRIEVPPTGIVLEQHLADSLGASVGDEVLVDGQPIRVEVLSFQCVSRSQYVSAGTAADFGEEDLGAVICNIDEADEQELLEYLSEQEGYLYTVFTRLAYEGSVRLLRAYDLCAWVIIMFAVIIGFVIVLNTARTNLLEKKKELCILRTLGFQHGEISRSWFSQSVLQFIVACILGFPAGRLVAQAALENVTIPTRDYIYANGVKEYILTAALVFLYMIASHLAAMRTVKKWDIVESVKEKE